METLPITAAAAQLAGAWTMHHRDPFDRMLAAQARIEGVQLITRDDAFRAFPVETVW